MLAFIGKIGKRNAILQCRQFHDDSPEKAEMQGGIASPFVFGGTGKAETLAHSTAAEPGEKMRRLKRAAGGLKFLIFRR
jgi:hypothetical protein